MKTVLVRDIPQDVYDKIVESANEEGRSINKQIIHLIKKEVIKYKAKNK